MFCVFLILLYFLSTFTFKKINFFKLNNLISNKNFNISITYTTNFKPADFLFFSDFKLFKNKKKLNNKIISRNFFLFLILLKHTNKNTEYKFNTSVFVKPNFKKFITLLRAPYKNKLARHQFMLSRYFVLFSVSLNFEDIFFNNITDLVFFINLSKNFYFWFESNIVSQHQVKLFFNCYFNNIFLIL